MGRQLDSRKFDATEAETISEALIDLYLSVKIRSNEEVSILRQIAHITVEAV